MAATSTSTEQAFVWIWLSDALEPTLAGRIDRDGPLHSFTYGQSYLNRSEAVPLYLPELPLVAEVFDPLVGEIAGCLRDAAPDGWGQRVIENDHASNDSDNFQLGILDHLLRTSSNRIGALGFSPSPEVVPSSRYPAASIEELLVSAERAEAGERLDPEIDRALLHGTSVGGARPKALLNDGERHVIAKFSSSTDPRPVMKGEYVAMELARRSGIDVAPVRIDRVMGKDVVLVDRFDRTGSGGRRSFVSALTILGLDELGARYATYWELADKIRARFTDPDATLRELFARITFNILVGNTDDHARNHGAFWSGRDLTLTPAYDICPQPRIGGEQQQAMAIGSDGYRQSQLVGCVERSSIYHLTAVEAREIVDHQIDIVTTGWAEVCDAAGLASAERDSFWGREFLNPYSLEGYS